MPELVSPAGDSHPPAEVNRKAGHYCFYSNTSCGCISVEPAADRSTMRLLTGYPAETYLNKNGFR